MHLTRTMESGTVSLPLFLASLQQPRQQLRVLQKKVTLQLCLFSRFGFPVEVTD